MTDAKQAEAVVSAIRVFDRGLAILGLPGSAVLAAAESAGLRVVREAFLDRAYDDDGTLVSRRQPEALITDPAGRGSIREASLRRNGPSHLRKRNQCDSQSLCLHGDHRALKVLPGQSVRR